MRIRPSSVTMSLLLSGAVALAGMAAAPRPAHADTVKLTPTQQAQQEQRRQAALEAAARWAARHPDRWARWVPPGTVLNHEPVPVEIRLRQGGTRTVLADPLLHTALSIGYGEQKANDRSNLGRLYGQLYQTLPAVWREGLADPTLVAALPVKRQQLALKPMAARLAANFELIRRDLSQTIPIGIFVNPIGDCTLETGHETAGADSETSARCGSADYAALGLMRNLDWVLKDDLTCVKDQTRRGTCVAHAIAANVETMIQVQGGDPVNLSEQDLYLWGTVQTDMAGRYSDGIVADEVYDALDAQNFGIQYESRWNYNRSPDRLTVSNPPPGGNYQDSCDPLDYLGELCTDFSFQSIETQILPGTYLYTSPPRAAQGWEILARTVIPDLTWLGQPDFQVDTAILMLEDEYPVHINFNVAASFRLPDANGYVQFNPADTLPTGKHAVLAVGFVANADLPAGVPADPDGRGYFVIKNSWGIDAADCGFYYVSSEFMRQWAYGFSFLDKNVTFR